MESNDFLEDELFKIDYEGYKPIEKCGNGFFSYVFKVIKGNDVKAVKVPKNYKYYNLIERGVEALIKLKDNPNVVDIYFDECIKHPQKRFPYYFMEYLDGKNLEERMAERNVNPLSIDRSCSIILEVIKALKDAHIKGICHGDIRPCNIFILNDGRIKLTDFDIYRIAFSDDKTNFKEKIETSLKEYRDLTDIWDEEVPKFGAPLLWAAPEHKDGIFNEKGDIFQVAKNLYFMLTGIVDNANAVPPSRIPEIGKEFAMLDEIFEYGLAGPLEYRTITLEHIENILNTILHRNKIPIFLDVVNKLNQSIDFSLDKIVNIKLPTSYSTNQDYKEKLREIETNSKGMMNNSSKLITEFKEMEDCVHREGLTDVKMVKEEIDKILYRFADRFSQDYKLLNNWIDMVEIPHDPETGYAIKESPTYKLCDNFEKYVVSFKQAPKEIKDLCIRLSIINPE